MSPVVPPAVRAAAFAATWALAATAPARAAPDPCATTTILDERFADESIASRRFGPARWTAHVPAGGDFGDAAFADPGPGGPFRVEGGVLSITASKSPDGRWRSGMIAAADASGEGVGTRYGYFEARMRFPPGPGTWPGFWLAALVPTRSPPPAPVEIDVVEYYGQFAAAYRTGLHVWGGDPASRRHAGSEVDVPAGSLTSAFHDYGVDVSPGGIAWTLDGRVVARAPTPPELDRPLFPMVDLALGGGWPVSGTPDPSTLLVQRVRVLSRGEGPPAGCPVGPGR